MLDFYRCARSESSSSLATQEPQYLLEGQYQSTSISVNQLISKLISSWTFFPSSGYHFSPMNLFCFQNDIRFGKKRPHVFYHWTKRTFSEIIINPIWMVKYTSTAKSSNNIFKEMYITTFAKTTQKSWTRKAKVAKRWCVQIFPKLWFSYF